MIDFLDNKQTDNRPLWNGWALAIAFFVCGEIESVFFCQGAFGMMTLGLKIKVALVGLIYQKVGCTLIYLWSNDAMSKGQISFHRFDLPKGGLYLNLFIEWWC